ncbi:hypothetical protein B7P43_G12513 [Cryptotermes secundus]|uniref:N-acetyltransferase domain-containing protein n=1 Tax=Cryptotermes secundus TaxID=105785 RepID=A0A2J7PU61_9NEOP|nr:uncharacterized protein LOC111871794 [Cryptotermes secundus]PNF19854.1 hypothetical protein B7P43_G12513 [Cryptotermes secundus]
MAEEKSTWKRPDSLQVPTVWRRCEGLLQMSDGKKPKFIIQDLDEEYLEEAIELMSTCFCKDEVMFSALKIIDDPISMEELKNLWRDMSRQKAALVALTDDGSARPRVVGVNMTYVCRIQDKYSPDDFRGTAMKAMARDGMVFVCNYVNIFKLYGVTEFLGAFGLVVHPHYRGQGLGVEILRTRRSLGKALGLKVTMTFFSTVQGQKSAEKAGMQLLAQLPYSIFKTEDGKEVYPISVPKTLKIMAMRLD